MYYTYILECVDKSFYVGSTNDMKNRLYQHNNSEHGAEYTKIRRPVKLVYLEKYKTLTAARRREKELKGWRREKKIILIANAKVEIFKKPQEKK